MATISNDSAAILLTGRPGVGKTTIIRKIVSALGDSAGGFYTSEVRHGGTRVGFELTTLDGDHAWLASLVPEVNFPRATSMGRYRVNLDTIEMIGVPALLSALHQGQVIVLDEIGPMEMRSRCFCEVVWRILDSGAPLVGTIVLRPDPFADQVKTHSRVRLYTVTLENRERLHEEMLGALRSKA
jgi:nucleoside-triphosphatase